jgi:hypothetical protein
VYLKTRRPITWALALVGLWAFAGCARREVLSLHYLNGFVLGTHAIFTPAVVAVAPVGGDLASGTQEVGAVYDSGGQLEKFLRVPDPGATIHDALMTGLTDAGLKPIALDAAIDPKALRQGIDVMLTCELQQLEVKKHFGAEQTIHGQYFTMTSHVKLRFKLMRRDGSLAYESELTGIEDEPPKPVGGEVFFPLETEPAESLSVALSRAIGALLMDPKFRANFPPRASP